ncbi:MAG: tetratricopeptide repeat protein [Acidobacteriaceae bacterium]
MSGRFGLRCVISLLTVSAVAQQPESGSLDSLLKDGALLSGQADYAHAIPILLRAQQLAPRNYLANLLLGEDLLRNGHPSNAVAPLRIAAAVRADDETAEGYLGKAEEAQGNFALSAEAFQAAVARSPNSENALVGWAEYCLDRFRAVGLWMRSSPRGVAALLRVQAQGTPSGTLAREQLLQQAAAADPEQVGIWGELGMAQAETGKQPDAENSLATALKRQPHASSTWKLEALKAAAQGHWSEAESRLQALGGRSNAELQRALAEWPRALIPKEDVRGAIWQCLREGSTDCPSEKDALEGRATSNPETLFTEERWEQLAAVPPPKTDQGSLWFHRGVALAQIGDCPQAIPSLERGLKEGAEAAGYWLIVCYASEAGHATTQLAAQNKEVAVHRIRGDILLSMKGDASAANAEYGEALRLKPGDPDLLEKSAEAYLASGDLDHAQQSGRAALTEDPNRETTLQLLVRIAMNQRDYQEALRLLDRLQKMEPEDPWTRVQVGTAYAQTDHPQDAVHSLEPVLAAGYPDEKGALHALLAGQLRKLGREQEAKSAAEEAIRLANSFQEHSPKSQP